LMIVGNKKEALEKFGSGSGDEYIKCPSRLVKKVKKWKVFTDTRKFATLTNFK